jgi:hypothetical protein
MRFRVLLLNGLILPGSGHIYTKRYASGAIILVLFLVTSVMAIYRFAIGAFLFFNSVEDFGRIGEFYVMLFGDPAFLKPFAISISVWLASLIDGWRITRATLATRGVV